MRTFRDYGIEIPEADHGEEVRAVCPKCSPNRKKGKERDLCVNIKEGKWFCHHCGDAGDLRMDDWKDKQEEEKDKERNEPYQRSQHNHADLPSNMVEWLRGRGISQQVLFDHAICLGKLYDRNDKKNYPAIKFPYFKDGAYINAKYRTLDKKFCQDAKAEPCLYRFDEISRIQGDILIITEGEIDALSFCQAAIKFVTSVPNGAPAINAKNYEREFKYLDSARLILDRCKKIILAVDNDPPGRKLEEELARRLGVEKCWRVFYPHGCKDANDVLVKHGIKGVHEIIDNAKPFPVAGIFTCGDVKDLVLRLYDKGEERGALTGWPILDRYYTVKPGQMTVVTGVPSHGKSTFVDALIVNLLRSYDWSFAMFSPENWPIERHMQGLLEKFYKFPFDRRGIETPRMSRAQVETGLDILNDRFHFLMPDEDLMTVDSILEKARVTVFRNGVRGLVMDPWNELEHDFGRLSETQYISAMLGKIRRFARLNNVHVWLIAHPHKLLKDKDSGKYKPPTMYEIAGGAHWRNKADVGLCVHRPDMTKDITDVYVQKVRFREVGKIGGVRFRYVADSGTYIDDIALGVSESVNDTQGDRGCF